MQEEDHQVTPELHAFVDRYRGGSFPSSDALFRGIDEGAFSAILRYPTTQPCSEIAQVYRDRAVMADAANANADHEMLTEFSLIADTLAESPDEPCRLWLFRGGSACFSVFVMEHSERIAGCLRRDGTSKPNPKRNEEA